jgi:hypothetical protein
MQCESAVESKHSLGRRHAGYCGTGEYTLTAQTLPYVLGVGGESATSSLFQVHLAGGNYLGISWP